MIRHQRKVFPEWQKRRIAWQQNYQCAICQKLLPFAWELDHIQPLFLGGGNERQNVQILCSCCHAEKSIIERAAPVRTAEGEVDMNWARCPERPRGRDRERQCPDCRQVVSAYFQHDCGVAGEEKNDHQLNQVNQ